MEIHVINLGQIINKRFDPMQTSRRQGNKVAVIIQVNSTLQEEIILTASEGMKLADEILTALPETPIRS